MENKMPNEDKFLANMKSKYDKKGKDNEALVAKKTSMSEILEGNVLYPEKLHIAGPVGKVSVKEAAPRANELQGKDGKEFSEGK